MNEQSRIYYTALLPMDETCAQVNRWARLVGNALGEKAFLLQHPANYHVTTGLFSDANLPASFPKPNAPGLPAFKAKELESGSGKLTFDLYYRKTTKECCLTLSLPFPQAAEWLQAESPDSLTPHITLGKFTAKDYKTPESREKLKKDIAEGNPPFQEFPKILEQIQWEYAGNRCCFDMQYVAPAKPQRLAVTSHPSMQRPQNLSVRGAW